MSAPDMHPKHAARRARMSKGPALSYVALESLIIEAESAVEILRFVFDRTVREKAMFDHTGERSKVVIVLDEDDYTVLTEAEGITYERMQKLVDAHDHAHRIEDARKPLPIEEQVL